MREGWEMQKMEDVCSSILKGPFGSDIKKSLYVPKGDGAYKVYIQVNAIKKDESLGDYYISNDYFKEKMHRFEVKPNDYIITCDGTLGKYLRLSSNMEKGIISASLLKITLKDTILPKFFEHLWDGYILQRLVKEVRNTALQHLPSAGKMSKALIPVPPIAEQEKIVAELDCLTGIIEKKKQQLEELDKLAQSIFYDMFGDPITNEKGWEVKKLEEMVSVSCSISYGIVQPGDGELTGVPVVRPVDLRDTYTHNVGLKLTTKEISNAYKRTILKGNELLLCVRGTTGIVSLAAKDLSGCNVSRGISPLEFNPSNNRFFMLYQFKAPSVQMIIADLTHGIALKGMNMADVRKMRLSQPPLDLQNEFAQKVEAIEKQKELVKRSIVEAETLFNSRMDYWFN